VYSMIMLSMSSMLPSSRRGALELLGSTGAELEHPRAVSALKCASDCHPPWLEHPRPTEFKYKSTKCFGVRYF
jgi:hypothetical protein